ncbi:alpha/beta-hydrolase [Hypomontagnella submonticulosa]|nr:alpha/beta-hydrolase [Hypomontagnella submonticulosa]
MASDTSSSGWITVPDGVRLRYWQDGPATGPNLVFIPGWVQTAAQFKKQVEYFKAKFRVTTYDHRGHGESDKPAFGYRLSRLAADLEALLTQLDLRSVTLIGHSMGAAVTWAHWDLFAHDRIAKLVFADQSPTLSINPAWTPEQILEKGGVFLPEARYELINALRGPQWKEAWASLSKSFFSPDVDAKDVEWFLQQQMKSPPEIAAALMIDHSACDWCDVFPRINVPVLGIGAKGSLMAYQGMEWIVKQTGGRIVTFEKEEGGSHFMFWENPEKFNRVVEEFLLE